MSHHAHSHESLTVIVRSAHELDSALGSAIGSLQERAAAAPCCGILVTREAAGKYTVVRDQSVPYGLTQQRCA
ncbi:hypothetical protein GCM10012320_19340 [Sinomonas cellulolyticus]|jgi:hypothetical protein|uniref:Uncharacterized protein n=1 Tax=Sinomonas cellulolyticus TaxID=2801916 RepID=A0ABS1K6L0_9MICC|nr:MULTISPECIES: hypothetical protein [Sinomonas]MBL0707309.1 hypothetical protein [Sinomonas cellulolyticus]GHG50592.1 hypothetical protein GCM10012320_19340 [Sinomonas sp. KCTC 49339]